MSVCSTMGNIMPAYISSAAKLEGLMQLFVGNDNGKLDQGEIEALTGFFGGLKPASQAKIRPALADIYATSKFSAGQKAKLFAALKQLGFTTKELEGVSDDNATSFVKLSKQAQLTKLLDIEQGNVGACKDVVAADAATDARSKIATDQKQVQAEFVRQHSDAEFSDPTWQALYAKGDKTELLGYALLVPIYADEHDVDRMYFYNLRGVRVGEEYRGE